MKNSQDQWQENVEDKEKRKIRARHHKDRSIWFGLGTFGVIGWSVVVPTLIGLFIGIWIDNTWQSRYSWTLILFMGGLVLGCYSAWNWLNFESGMIEREEQKKNKNEDKQNDG